MDMLSIREKIRAKGLSLGLSVVRFTKPVDTSPQLKAWLEAGYHGQMAWLEKDPEKRGNPKALWPGVNTVVAVGLNYGPTEDPLPRLQEKSMGNISTYARGDDYHKVLRHKVRALGYWMGPTFKTEVKSFVDHGPVMEKPLAHAAGVGWPGKHTNLVSRKFGSWLFLGALFTALDLPPDDPEPDHCGSCRKCLDVCPTQAFPAPYQLDARRCLSYLTIEHDGPFPPEFRKAMGNRIYGCDDCLSVCPWNKYAQTAAETRLHARTVLDRPALADLAQLDDASFRDVFAVTAIKRIGRDRFVRNVLIAIGNSGDATLRPVAEKLTADPNPAVADAARWAVGELSA